MTLAQIKALFKTGAIPTQSDFESLIDKIPNNEGGGDKTVNVETPNKPFINGFRTIVDRDEGWTYYIFLALYDESGGSGFESAYKYPALILRMKCELGESPVSGNYIQYAFGDWSESLWNQDGNDWNDTEALTDLKSYNYTFIDTEHHTYRKNIFDNNEGMYRNYIFETDRLMHSNGVFNIPYQITEVRTSNGDDMVTHSYIYRITENVNFEDIQRQWDIIKMKNGPTKEDIDDGFLQMFYYALQ